jgi:hypothetical protein
MASTTGGVMWINPSKEIIKIMNIEFILEINSKDLFLNRNTVIKTSAVKIIQTKPDFGLPKMNQ